MNRKAFTNLGLILIGLVVLFGIIYLAFPVFANILSVTLNNPDDGSYTNETQPTLYFTAISDTQETLDVCTLYINGSSYGSWSGVVHNNTEYDFVPTPPISTGDGLYEWNVGCDDGGGEVNSTSRTFILDTEAPTVELNGPESEIYTKEDDVIYNWTATDNLDDPITCTIRLDQGLDYFNLGTFSNVVNATPKTATYLDFDDGFYKWYVNCSDGINTIESDERNFTIDTTDPDVNLTDPEDNYIYNSNPINFTCDYYDEYNVTNVSLYGEWNGGWHVNETSGGLESQEGSIDFNEITLEDGIFEWNCEFCDMAGNCAFNEENYTLTVDSVGPILEIGGPVNGLLTDNNNVTYNWTVTDNLDEILSCSLYLNEELLGNFNSVENATPEIQIYTENEDGFYEWQVNCSDGINVVGIDPMNYTIDTNDPEIELNGPESGSSIANNSLIEFNFTVTDNVDATLTCELLVTPVDGGGDSWEGLEVENGTAYVPYGGFNSSIFEADGVYLWNVTCSDGINEVTSETWNFTKDSVIPDIELNGPVDELSTTEDDITYNWTATDNRAETLVCWLFVDGSRLGTFSSVDNATPEVNTYTNVARGTHNWNVTCSDEANNVTSETRTFTIRRSGGGGGGGTYNPINQSNLTNQTQNQQGVEENLGELNENRKVFIGVKNSVKFILGGEEHKILVNSVNSEYVVLLIYSDPLQLVISSGKKEKVDLNKDGEMDLEITFNGLVDGEASLNVNPLVSKVELVDCAEGYENINGKCVKTEEPVKQTNTWVWIVIIAIVVLLTLYMAVIGSRKKKRS